MRRMTSILLALLIAALTATAAPSPASAARGEHPCKRVKRGGEVYQVYVGYVRCHYARKWTRRMLRSNREPRGWLSCYDSGSAGGCSYRRGDDRPAGRNRYFYWRQIQ